MPIPLGIFATAGASGGSAGAYELIATNNPNEAINTTTFSSIPLTYKHLQLRVVVRNSESDNIAMIMRMNGDSGSNYRQHNLMADGSGVYSGYGSQTSQFSISYQAGSSNSAVFTPSIIDILDYASTSKNTTIRVLQNGMQASTGNRRVQLLSGLYISNSAISSLSFTMPNVFGTGSRLSLYGIKG